MMAMRRRLGRSLLWIDHESPNPVISCDAMRDTLIHQPVEYPVNGNTVNRMVIDQHPRNVQMRSRALTRQQTGEHRNARLGEPFAGGADGGFGGGKMGEVGWLHGELHLTRCEWQLQLSRMDINWLTLALARVTGHFIAVRRAGRRSAW